MENFILWSPSFDKKTHQVSFFVTPIHVQRVAKGTREMVTEMLADLGVKDPPIKSWSTDHFLTNYMTDEPDAENWEDLWGDTWEVKVKGPTRAPAFKEGTALIRSYARDKTWDGDEESLPSELVVVADSASEDATTRAENVIEAVGKVARQSPGAKELAGEIDIPPGLLKSIAEAAGDRKQRGRRKNPLLSVRRRDGQPNQLLVSVGTVDEKFFEDGAKLAGLVVKLVGELQGTTTWDEKTTPAEQK